MTDRYAPAYDDLLRMIKAYCDSGDEFSPEALATHLWGNMAQLEALQARQTGRHKPHTNPRQAGLGITGATLRPAQLRVLALLAQGKRRAEIAAELGLSKHTIQRHLADIGKQLGIHTGPGLAAWWWQQKEAAK